ncbi:MAG: glycoside hydrolase family 78 protein [Anaerolineae bacterium]|nr:glycoside hydrolase family 78 protein [Anaerolineae bacterium]
MMNADIETPVSIKNLRTENLVNPLGIDTRKPKLSWQIASERRNVTQRAYQIQVAASGDALAEAHDLMWDSGRADSDNTIAIRYDGPDVQSGQRCVWRVRVWDQDDRASEWSEPAWWEMGLLAESEWTADWIEVDWDDDPKAFKPCPFFRRAFTVDQPVTSARLYITAHGLYEAWLNDQRVGDQVFTPGYTPYDKQLQYQVYDVTALLQQGENALGAILGDGWYRGKVYGTNARNVYGERLGLLALLRIEMAAGQVIVASDGDWKATTGPILKSDMKDGETYDARLELPRWSSAGYDDGTWKPVRTASHAKHHLIASMGVPVRRKEIFAPQAILKTPKGETVLDFGQNLAGVVRMKARGPRGTIIRLRHGETLSKDGNFTIAHLLIPAPNDDKPPVFQEVHYTLKGDGEEEYEPRFTVHGFRYVKVEGYPGEPTIDDFAAVALYSDMPPTGTFTCSDPQINQLHKNVEWSMKGNFLDLPTDCPQRERAGWTGDAQVFAPSASFLMDTQAFLRRWLRELALEQAPDGKVGNFVPDPYRVEGGLVSRIFKWLDGAAGWSDVAVMMPWDIYRAFGDVGVLEDQYESMKAWVEFERARAKRVNWSKKLNPRYWLDRAYRERQQYIIDTGYHWGEWLEPGRGTPTILITDTLKRILFGAEVVATAYFAHSARLLAKAAELLGKGPDAQHYNALADKITAVYVEQMIGSDGRMEPDMQASYARALAFDLAPEALRPAMVEHLVRLVRASGNHIGTGFLSTVFLCDVLADGGHPDVAYDLLTQKTIPSWLYAVTRGATTIWETWEGIREDGTAQMSLNHYSPGAVIGFLHRRVGGIAPAEPGYRRITIAPLPGDGLTSACAEYESVRGLIRCEWAREGDRMTVNVTLPANTRATVRLPGAEAGQVTESGVPLAQAEGLGEASKLGKDTQLELGSGIYRFEYPVS